MLTVVHSGGSRISCWGGANLRRVHFSAKTYVKMKEIDPVGGEARRGAPLDPPMDYYRFSLLRIFSEISFNFFTSTCIILSPIHINLGALIHKSDELITESPMCIDLIYESKETKCAHFLFRISPISGVSAQTYFKENNT